MAFSRKQSREIAYRIIFGMKFDEDALEMASSFGKVCELPTGVERSYIEKLCSAVIDNVDAIDEIIKGVSDKFVIERIYKTDLTAIRLGIGEAKFYGQTPITVSINEAVEIAKKYGTEKSASFVNGILGKALNGDIIQEV